MRRALLFATLFAAGGLAASGCGAASPAAPSATAITASNPGEAARFTISGVVRESLPAGATGAPVRGVTLEVLTKPGLLATAISDQNGAFHIDGVAGTFQLRETKAGYETRTVRVGPVTAAQTVDATLTPIPRALSGLVTEMPPTAATPVGAARIEVVTGSNAGTATTTDSAGRYTLPAMWGEFDLRVGRDGFVSKIVHVDMAAGDARGDAQVAPMPRVVTETFENTGVETQFRVVIPVHNAGEIAIADWASYGFEEGDGATLQVWEDGRLLAQTFVERSIPRHTVLLRVPAVAGRTYEVRGLTIFWWIAAAVTHPN